MITIRRGGTLTHNDHRLLALWAAECAEHVLQLFEDAQPSDARPREAIEAARAWAGGEMTMMDARSCGGHAMGAARRPLGAPRHAAYAAGQAACVGHVAVWLRSDEDRIVDSGRKEFLGLELTMCDPLLPGVEQHGLQRSSIAL